MSGGSFCLSGASRPPPRSTPCPATDHRLDFHVFDTTLRDGAQREGVSYSVADKLAVARLHGRGRRRLHRGRLARRAAQGHRVLRPRPHRAQAPARPAGRVRRHPQGRRPAWRTTRRCGRCSTRRRRSCAWSPSPTSGTSARRLRTTLEENLAMVADTVAFFVAHGRRVFLDCEHFFDGYAHDRDYGVAGARGRLRRRRRGRRHVRHQRRDAADGRRPGRRRRPVAGDREARHPLPGRHRLRGRQLAGRGRGRGHPRPGDGERLRRARGQRRHVLADRQPGHQDGPAGRARRVPARAAAGQPRDRRAGQHRARRPPALRRGRRPSRTRPACTPAPSR